MHPEEALREKLLPPDPPQPHPVQSYQPMGLLAQTWLLIGKNFILTIKNPKNIIFLLLTPFLLSAFLFLFQGLARDSGQRTRPDPTSSPLPPFPACMGSGCRSLEYRVIQGKKDSEVPRWINYTVDYIRMETGLGGSMVEGGELKEAADLEDYYKEQQQHANRTQIGLLFCGGSSADVLLGSFYCNGSNPYTYFLVLNKTDSLSVLFHDFLQPLPIDPVASSLKLLVDNAILSFLSGDEVGTRRRMELSQAQFPVGENKYIDGYDIVTTIGAFYYLITPLFAFLFMQNEVVREKQLRLRQGLNIFGASHLAYWGSWFAVANLYSLLVALSTWAAGEAFGFGFFTETPFYVTVLLLLYPFCLAMQMLAFCVSSVASSLKASNTVSYGIMLFAIVVEAFVSDNMLLTFLFSEDSGTVLTFLKYFFCFYPPFSYTKIFTNITQFSGCHFSFVERRWVPSPVPYDWDIYSQNLENPLPFGGGKYYRYSDLLSTLVLFGDAAFFLLLTWYFDHTIASNRGRSEPFSFPFNRLARFFPRPPPKLIQDELPSDTASFSLQGEEESAVRERNRVYANSRSGVPALGLRIQNLSKTFGGSCGEARVEALRGFTLEIEQDELMGVLGHNGAGKTTLINILTGVLTPDHPTPTQIVVAGHPLSDIHAIRNHIGVCAQFDILWDELTAEEHLRLFARLKGVPPPLIDQRIDQTLAFVNLLPEKKAAAGSFSGGMKRRLSLAIAAVGDPKIILLDEPTTGLDPKVRAQVWQLVQRLKRGRSIILTTHSMEEADVLADRLCVVVKGRMKCVGSPFQLKKTYGEGHRLAINLRQRQDEGEVVARIQKMYPSVRRVDCRGGSLILGIPDYQELLSLVRKLESSESLGLDEYELKKQIRAWAVSHSTLEEVFMKVTREKED